MPDPGQSFDTASTWKDEIDRSRAVADQYKTTWEENLRYFEGKSPDARLANENKSNWVNVNADFTAAEVKKSQLFYETPDIQLTAKGFFKERAPAAQMPGQPPPQTLPADPILFAHREILNDLLGPDGADVLPMIHKVILDCLVTAGRGATKISFTAAQDQVEPPAQLGAILGLQQAVPLPLDEQFSWDRIPSLKLRVPADFKDTDFDKAPWLGMDFRMPLSLAKTLFNIPEDYSGTSERDIRVLESSTDQHQTTNIPYVEGTELWYYASLFDQDVKHPRVIRRHVVLDNYEGFVEKTTENPYQTILPTGRLSADSMLGYPIHVLSIRSLPDNAYVPSDSSMIRPLVRELCTFRTQQVQERDANIPRILVDIEKLTPDVVQKIQDGVVGSIIPVGPDVLMNGVDKVMAQVVQGTQTRGSYTANDYIQHDLDRTLGMDSIGAGVSGQSSKTATEVGTVDKIRSIRLDHERRVILAWYLKGVQKFSSLVCRFLTPQLATPLIGQAAAQAWAGWDKKTWDGRFVFNARPDSQIKLDAASERKFALDLYQFLAKDPQVNRGKLLENLLTKAGLNPAEIIVPPPEPKHPDPAIGFTFKAEDLLGPAAQQVREIAAQCGLKISQQAISMGASQLFQQMTLGIRDADGHAVKTLPAPAPEHGGVADQVRPLDQQSSDLTGQRPGVKPQVQ